MAARANGYALILVLWVLVLLTTIAMAFIGNVRTDTHAALSLTSQVRLAAAADAAIAMALDDVLSAEDRAAAIVRRGSYEIPWPDATLRVTMRSESAKIDLNYAPRPLLIGLFQEVLPEAPAGALADALLDWRDRDDRRSPQGAEAAEYQQAGRRGPANKPLQSISELNQVMGFNSDFVDRLEPYVTIWSKRPRIDPYTADATVLAAIPGLDQAGAQAFVNYRDGRGESAEPVQLDQLSAGARYLDRRPSFTAVNIHVEARNTAGRGLAREAIARFSGRATNYLLLDWRQTTLDQP